MHHTHSATVRDVVEKFASGAAVKTSDGRWNVPRRSLGWFIVTTDNIAYGVGAAQPTIAAGDTIGITLEKMNDAETKSS